MKLRAMPAMSNAQTLLIALTISAMALERSLVASLSKTGLLVPTVISTASDSDTLGRAFRTFLMAMFWNIVPATARNTTMPISCAT